MNEIVFKRNNELTLEQLNQYQESFIDFLDVDDKTLRAYRVGINCLMEYLRVNNIKYPTRNNLIGFRDMLRETYSSNTTNTYMIAVRALFRYLEVHKLYDNICEDIKGAKYSNTPKKQVLTQEQAKMIYKDLTDKREKCLFSILLSTGLRGVEVARATLEDIQDFNNEIVLWVQCKKHDDKDEYVKLSPQVIDDIKNYVGDRTSGSIFISTSPENYGQGLSTTSLRKIIKNIFKRYGLDSNTFSLHSMRRSSATLMYENGADLYSIQQVLHHKSSATTTRYINAVTRNNNKNEYIVSNAIFS